MRLPNPTWVVATLLLAGGLTGCGGNETSDSAIPEGGVLPQVPLPALDDVVQDDVPTDVPENVAAAEPEDICGPIGEDRTLVDRGAGTDYVASCDVGVGNGATLTIEPNVEIAFAAGVQFSVTGSAAVRALGGFEMGERVGSPITLRGASTSGLPSWVGLLISSSNVDNYLENVLITGAGSGTYRFPGEREDPSALVLKGEIQIRGLSIESSGGNGMSTNNNLSLNGFEDVTIGSTESHPLYTTTQVASTVLGPVADEILFTTMGSEITDTVGLYRALLDDAEGHVFVDFGLPYFSYNGFFGNGAINMEFEPGVEFIMNAGVGITSGRGGAAFRVNGSPGRPIVFRGSRPDAGHWRGVEVIADSPTNVVEFARISDAENGLDINGGISLTVTLDVTNTTVDNTSACAVKVVSRPAFGRTTFSASANTFTGNGEGTADDPDCLGNFTQ